MENELINKIIAEFNAQGVDDVSVRLSQFLGKPWLYLLVYHNGRGIIYDMSVETYNTYGICLNIIKDEWSKKWNERW